MTPRRSAGRSVPQTQLTKWRDPGRRHVPRTHRSAAPAWGRRPVRGHGLGAVARHGSGIETSTTAASRTRTRSFGARWRLTPLAPPPIATTGWSRIARVGEDGPRSSRAERRDRVPDVARDALRLVRVREREPAHAEVGSQLRPVEPPARGHEHEQVVVLATAHDDRSQQRAERYALHRGALLGAVGLRGPDDPMIDGEHLDRFDGRRPIGRGLVAHR